MPTEARPAHARPMDDLYVAKDEGRLTHVPNGLLGAAALCARSLR